MKKDDRKDYRIITPCRPDGITYMEEGTVALTDSQAKYLVMDGHIEPVTKKTGTSRPAKAKTA